MKALTVSQPYASLIASGEKWVENRDWFTQYRGPLGVHAGLGTQYMTRREMREQGLPTGAVVATAELVAIVRIRHRVLADVIGEPAVSCSPGDLERLKRACITLADIAAHAHSEGPWGWVLANVRALPEPVPAKGAMGLWDWEPQAAPALPAEARP